MTSGIQNWWSQKESVTILMVSPVLKFFCLVALASQHELLKSGFLIKKGSYAVLVAVRPPLP